MESVIPDDGADASRSALLAERRAAGEVRVEAALAAVLEAQRLIETAAEALLGVEGMAAESRKLGALGDRVARALGLVKEKRARLRSEGSLLLDHLPDSYEARWTALRRGRS